MKKKKVKYLIAIILIILFTFSAVPKSFENDTFYIIQLGKDILKNGIDWKDHYSIHTNLEYCYPHWAFDVMNYGIYYLFDFYGIYTFTQIFASIFMLIIFWNMLRKEINFNLAFISTCITAYLLRDFFHMRSQIISYPLLFLEYMILENYVQRPTFFKTLALFLISCIIANIHSTAWMMMLILVLPFVGEQVIYFFSLKGLNERVIKKYQKQYKNAKNIKEKDEIREKLREQKILKEKLNQENKNNKIIINRNQNLKYIWVAVLIMIFGALCTPLKLTPFTYLLKTNFGNSLNYIKEHLPIVFADSSEIIIYSIFLIALLGFTKSKLKTSDAFLILGLYFMTLHSVRYLFLLIGLTSGIVVKMIDDFIKENTEENLKFQNKIYIVFGIITILGSSFQFFMQINDKNIDNKIYPVDAVEFIKNNLDYQNIRLYHNYEQGSYLLLQGIPVFIDSRCDLYTEPFNKGMEVFDDAIAVTYSRKTISEIMKKYDLEYALVPNGKVEDIYMSEDEKYKEIYKDDYYAIYQYEK